MLWVSFVARVEIDTDEAAALPGFTLAAVEALLVRAMEQEQDWSSRSRVRGAEG